MDRGVRVGVLVFREISPSTSESVREGLDWRGFSVSPDSLTSVCVWKIVSALLIGLLFSTKGFGGVRERVSGLCARGSVSGPSFEKK